MTQLSFVLSGFLSLKVTMQNPNKLLMKRILSADVHQTTRRQRNMYTEQDNLWEIDKQIWFSDKKCLLPGKTDQ